MSGRYEDLRQTGKKLALISVWMNASPDSTESYASSNLNGSYFLVLKALFILFNKDGCDTLD